MNGAGARFLVLAVLFAAVSPGAELTPKMSEAFDRYVKAAEARIEERVRTHDYLWADDTPERLKMVREGQVAVSPLIGKGDGPLAGGLVHDWIGGAFVPGATLAETLASVQDYNRNKITHRPEVVDSKLLERDGNHFRIYLRLTKKKVITVVLDTEHDARFFPVDPTFCHSRSYSTKIVEVENPGKPDERALAPGEGHGFLWRLNSYWRFLEKDGGVYIECQAVSLTRDVPTGLGWLIEPIIRGLPRESLVNTLNATRAAIRK